MHHLFHGWCESTPCESSPIVKYRHANRLKFVVTFKNEKRSCITISRVLTSGGADRLSANRVESSSASDESTLVGCIGHVCADLRDLLANKICSTVPSHQKKASRDLVYKDHSS